MALRALTRTLGSLSLSPAAAAPCAPSLLPATQVISHAFLQSPSTSLLLPYRPVLTSVALNAKIMSWKSRTKYTITPVKMRKSGGRDHTGRIRVHGIGGGHKQRYRMIDFLRFRAQQESKPAPFEEKVIAVRYDPCRSADIALVAGGSRKRWIIATENMKAGDVILNSNHIGRMAVAAQEGDAHPLGALPVGTLINNVESEPGRGAQYIRAAGTCGVLLRKVNGTAIIQLPSKRQMQVLETCTATVGRVSNIDHNKRVIGKAGRNRWLGKRPSSGLWHRKGGWAGRKIRPLPPMKSYVKLPLAPA
ncbi:large ribosomal subunit protein uL2m [Tenrec ecaudatus]|uniref:large ribosomal subunit protein uL2m n=1 Tax=Tenrec ecaudatus TaxID=94439 RepID=UPI003F5AC4AE